MRVLYLINGLGTGGAERSLSEMLPLLRDRGVDVTVGCLFVKPEGVKGHVVNGGFDVRYFPGRHAAARIAAVRKAIRGERPDVVHTTVFEADLIGRLAAVRTRVPVLTSLVNTSYDSARLADPNVRPWKLRMIQRADGWTSRHLTSRFHAITDAVKQAAVHDLGLDSEKITVIHRGRDPKRLGEPCRERRKRIRTMLGLADDAEVLINVGRQEFQKGQRFLLEAFEKLALQRPKLVLIVAGRKGNATRELQHIVHGSSILRERVQFLGHRDDVPDLLAAADVFVFPSLYEGLGGAVIEAMALGLPIVASDVPAVREVTEDERNAALVPPSDPDVLADTLGRLLGDPARREAYGLRSRAIYEEKFTLDRVVDRMTDLYREVAQT